MCILLVFRCIFLVFTTSSVLTIRRTSLLWSSPLSFSSTDESFKDKTHLPLLWVGLLETLMLIFMQKINFITHIFFRTLQINFILPVFVEILQRYCKLVILGTSGMPGYAQKVILSRKLCCLSSGKKSTSSPCFSGDSCKDMQIYYFRYFGCLWLFTSKKIVKTCRKCWCSSACQK